MEEDKTSEEPFEEEISSDPLDRAEKCIENGDLFEAQNILIWVEEDSGRKHYLQSRIYKGKCWYNEQRKQLKAAIKKEPDNELYKKELDELTEFKKTAEYKTTVKHPKREQMGNTDGKWTDCCVEVCGYCLCEAICESICNGC